MPRDVLDVTGVHNTLGMYSHAVWLGSALYIAGQVAKDASNVVVGIGDIESQTRQVFVNLAVILREAGGDMDDIVKMTVFMTRPEDLPGYRRVRDEELSQPLPATTLVFVSGLAHRDYLIEIEAVATVDHVPLNADPIRSIAPMTSTP